MNGKEAGVQGRKGRYEQGCWEGKGEISSGGRREGRFEQEWGEGGRR